MLYRIAIRVWWTGCAALLSTGGLISICALAAINLPFGGFNLFLILPLALLYIYACLFLKSVRRSFIAFLIVIADMFPVLMVYNTTDAPKIIWFKDIFGTRSDIVMYKDHLLWNIHPEPGYLSILFLFGSLLIGFLMIEAAGYCFRWPAPKGERGCEPLNKHADSRH